MTPVVPVFAPTTAPIPATAAVPTTTSFAPSPAATKPPILARMRACLTAQITGLASPKTAGVRAPTAGVPTESRLLSVGVAVAAAPATVRREDRLTGCLPQLRGRLQGRFRLTLGKQLLGGLGRLLVVACGTGRLLPLQFQHQEVIYVKGGRSGGVRWPLTESVRPREGTPVGSLSSIT